jgi:cytoskeletal protein CcmA (bactofilin family)
VANNPTFSVIGTDVIIRGNVEASNDLHIDGTVEGDIVCASLVQGESSRVEGGITADNARLSGTIKGTINVRELVVLRSARVDGDVHYETLTIEQGANVNGRFAPDAAASRAKAQSKAEAQNKADAQGKTEAQAQAQARPVAKPPENNGTPGAGEPRLTLAG